MTKLAFTADNHQHLLEETLFYENAKSVVQNHKACAVECNPKRVSSLTV